MYYLYLICSIQHIFIVMGRALGIANIALNKVEMVSAVMHFMRY